MKYTCVDRGTERCPCHLMAAGQCYTCTMVQGGMCCCGDGAGWQGVCPYIEYLQQGKTVRPVPSDCLSPFRVLNKIFYAKDLFVVELAVPAGFAEKCRGPGAYVMIEALGWRTPVSVLRARSGGPGATGGGVVELLVKTAGPKTKWLAEDNTGWWKVAGPYFNGILNYCKEMPGKGGRLPDLVIARGSALAPLVNLLDGEGRDGGPELPFQNCQLYIDDEILPEAFLEEYLRGWVYESIRLNEAAVLERLQKQVHGQVERGGVLLLVSPFFSEKLCQGLTEKERAGMTVSNHANLCCAMGLCGACSYTDRDGITVRLCKCGDAVVK